MAAADPPPPWWEAYPAPRDTQPGSATREEVLAMLKAQGGKSTPADFLLIDVRRVDYEVSPSKPHLGLSNAPLIRPRAVP